MDRASFQLRPASDDDAPLILSILRAAFEEYRGRVDPLPSVLKGTVDSIRKEMSEGGFIIAWAGEAPAGCVFYQPYSGHLYLGHLAVLPPYRGRGLARDLIAAVEQQALDRRLPSVQLGVRLALPHLQDYYSRLGYRLLHYGTHEGFTQPTYAIMEKKISGADG